MLIKELPTTEKPRERLKKYGVRNLSDVELLSIILRIGIPSFSVKDISINLLKDIDTITNLKKYSLNKLAKIKGIGEVKAMSLIASLELGRRVYLNTLEKKKIKLNTTLSVYEIFKDYFIDSTQEQFLVIFLDSKKYLIDYKVIFIGTLNQSLIHPREIFKEALLASSDTIICLHNHPSGDTVPSNADIELTTRLYKVSKIMGISILDHIIIGQNRYFSFLENEILK